ncbi:Mitochondrial matrix iron chaperone [Coemansia sp. RSA 2706]|nr:Mitochondrial matrix iron chaperone [Coemansia sp. RSA 2706]
MRAETAVTSASVLLPRTGEPTRGVYRISTIDAHPHFAITAQEYDRLADEAMDKLVTFFEDLGDGMDIDAFDVEYSQGVMTLILGDVGTYVVNKQPPNRQIWISSPISGPERFDFSVDRNAWVCRKTSDTLGKLLERELRDALAMADLAVPIK